MSRDVVVSLRVTEDEAKALRRRAKLLGTDVSGLLRRALSDEQPDWYRITIGDGSPMIMWGDASLAVMS